jgi:hypothetical protein
VLSVLRAYHLDMFHAIKRWDNNFQSIRPKTLSPHLSPLEKTVYAAHEFTTWDKGT